jgi:16S rRNA processing protein RimM
MMDDDSAKAGESLVLVGEITAPFGIRGQVKMHPLIEKPQVLAKLPHVLLRFPSGREETRQIGAVRMHQHVAVVTFVGTEDRNGADSLRNAQVFIREDELPPLEKDAYYESQLLGLRVETESGRDLGRIERVLFYPANDVYETDVAMIPAIEDVVVQVDIAGGRLLVRDIPGLRKDE